MIATQLTDIPLNNVNEIKQTLERVAGMRLMRFDIPYPTPESGVIAALGFEGVSLEICRDGDALTGRFCDPLANHRGWVRIHPGLLVQYPRAYYRTIAADEKLVVEIGGAQLIISKKHGCTLLFPW